MRKEVHHVKEENVKLREMNKKNDTLIEHLRSRQIELEEMQSTAQETVMDSEARLGSAIPTHGKEAPKDKASGGVPSPRLRSHASREAPVHACAQAGQDGHREELTVTHQQVRPRGRILGGVEYNHGGGCAGQISVLGEGGGLLAVSRCSGCRRSLNWGLERLGKW